MKKGWGVALFLAGVGFGWVAGIYQRDEPPATEAAEISANAIPRDRKSESVKEDHAQKWKSLGKRVLTSGIEEQRTFIKELAPNDRGKALDALMSQVGPNHTNPFITSAIKEILKSWANDDLEGLLSYCENCSNDGMKKHMFDELLKILAEKDPDRAIELLAKVSVQDPSFRSHVVFSLARNRMGENADQLLDFLSKLPMRSIGGSSADFSPDYDFKSAADGIAALIKANSGKNPAVLPNNLIESWAARDPDTAHAWWVKNGEFAYNDWSEIFEGVEKHSTPEAAAAWVVSKFEEVGSPREKMIYELLFNSREGIAGKINTIARAMPDIAAQDRFLTDVALVDWSSSLGNYVFAVSGLSSPQARLATFQKLGEKNFESNPLSEISDAQFQAWGLTRQQVESMFKRK